MRLSPLQRWVGLVATAACALYVWFTLQPDLIFSSTTANGGDTGAHVWWPAYLRDHILPKWRLTGWAPDWYAGFPAGHFYFPLPSLLVVALDVFLPYNVAFKLVTALGPVGMPVAAYFFAKGIGARWPAPPLFAVATLPFLFFTGYQIYGGNLPSNLAGEFSFTIAMCFALCFMGALARALDERRRLALPAALLAATALSHVIVAVFAAVGAVVIWLLRRPVKNISLALAIGGVGTLITAVWSLPLVARLGYTTDMGWTKEPPMGPNGNLMPPDLRWAFLLAVVGVVTGIALWRRALLGLSVLALIFGAGFVVIPESRLWNARLLPFYYLSVLFLAAGGVAELANALGRAAAMLTGDTRRPPPAPVPPGAGGVPEFEGELAPIPPGATSAAEPDPPQRSEWEQPPAGDPGGEEEATVAAGARHPDDWADLLAPPEPPPAEVRRRRPVPVTALPVVVVVAALVAGVVYTKEHRKFIPSWIKWNYSGYEAKPAYPEFKEVIETMGKLPPGRALWEPSSGIDKYGTTLALELLPHFTDGRIGSMEGLYFESAATTPYHFLMVAELAKQPSNPVRDLQYNRLDADFDLGVRHMRLFGVRYYMAQSDEAKAKADAHPGLRKLAETGQAGTQPQVARWSIYEVLDAPLVEPLAYEPVVVTGVSHKHWLEPSAAWFDDPEALDRPLADGGPDSWVRATKEDATGVTKRPLPEVEVSDVRSGDDWVRFSVSRPGVPVLVKTSYFPNWKVEGAEGPWRVSPNLMVVVPTRTDVALEYGRTPVDLAGLGLTVLGLGGLVFLGRWRPAPLPARGPDDEEPAVAPEEESAPALV